MKKELVIGMILSCLLCGCTQQKGHQDKKMITRNEEEETMYQIKVDVNDRIFEAEFYKNKSTEKLVSLFPITLHMKDLHNNEKYHYLQEGLPTQKEDIQEINVGDILLFQDNCLVIFYEGIQTSYAYTKIGYIKNSEGLKECLGQGDILLSFSKEKTK